jgi:hypothetical protein
MPMTKNRVKRRLASVKATGQVPNGKCDVTVTDQAPNGKYDVTVTGRQENARSM